MIKFKSILTKISNQFLNIFDLEVKPTKYNHPEVPGFIKGLSVTIDNNQEELKRKIEIRKYLSEILDDEFYEYSLNRIVRDFNFKEPNTTRNYRVIQGIVKEVFKINK